MRSGSLPTDDLVLLLPATGKFLRELKFIYILRDFGEINEELLR